MDKAAAFTATYSDWRLIKGRKVVQVVLEIPLETSDAAYQVLGGMPNPAAETWCAVARLNQTTGKERSSEATSTQPASEDTDAPARAPNKLPQLAGMLSKTPLFHRYIETLHPQWAANEDIATEYIREHCGVSSRSQILPDTSSGDKFLYLYDTFMKWRDADTFLEPAQVNSPP